MTEQISWLRGTIRASLGCDGVPAPALTGVPLPAGAVPDASSAASGSCDLTVVRDGQTVGYDTLYLALFAAAYRSDIHFDGKKTVILGDGAAARTAAALARTLGSPEAVVLSPAPDGTFDLTRHHDVQILIGCADPPAGDRPAPELDALIYLEGVIDLTPLPLRTRLIWQAEENDRKTADGLYVAVAREAIAAGLQRGEPFSPSVIGHIYQSLRYDLANIVLVGMTGCGAEAVAPLLADATGRTVCHVPDDPDAVSRAGALYGHILLTDEALAEHPDYLYPLIQNARVYFFCRPLKLLDHPSLTGKELEARYEALLPTFRLFGDETITYAGAPAVPARELLDNFAALPYKKR